MVKELMNILLQMVEGFFRLTNLQFSVSTSLSGEKLKGEDRTGEKN
ncbi:MAG: hypothetical protein H6613_02520 [Ignavibacteriales bacterium]|nr:hypothetical protein [Ignavibacteriales bacterium]